MANDNSFLNNLLGWLKKMVNELESPVGGFNIDDVKVNKKGDAFSSLFQLSTDNLVDKDGNPITNIKGQRIELNVLLSAINAGEVFAPVFRGLTTNIDEDSFRQLLYMLIGDERLADTSGATNTPGQLFSIFADDSTESTVDSRQQVRDLSGLTAARDGGKGLLGAKLDASIKTLDDLPNKTYSFGGKTWSWKNIAEEYLRYALECQAVGRDYGAIENQSLANCSKLISEYLVKVDILVDVNEVAVNIVPLVVPVLARMQARLAEYYVDAYKKYEIDKAAKAENDTPSIEDLMEEGDNNEGQADHEAESTEAKENAMYDNLNKLGFVDSHGNPITKSKHIDMTLKKVTGSSEVQLLGLNANYAPSETLSDVEEIISQDEFLNALTEEPQAFSIAVDDDGYDIEQCECCEVDPCPSLNAVWQTAIIMYRNLYVLHWMSKGNDMMKLHLLSEELYEELIKEIDLLGELIVEKCGAVPDLGFEWSPLTSRPYEFQEGLTILKDFIQNYIDTIDFAYCNQASDVQSVFDEWLRFWNKQMNYFIKQQED